MIILPDRHIPKARILLPMRASAWREPSQAQPKDQFGRQNQTRFRVRARLCDSHTVWCGWFDDRDDFDAFIWAIAIGQLHNDPYTQRLPTPFWPGLDPWVVYDFATVTLLTLTASSPYSKPGDWNDASNTIECIGAGASGASITTGATRYATGGGAGAYSLITNFTNFISSQAVYNIGIGGAAVNGANANGNDGTVTWFNNATDPGVGTDNTKCSAQGGIKGVQGTGTQNGGLGGTGTSGWGQTRTSGGRGGNLTGAIASGASGGGGAAGPAGLGGNGVDSASTATNTVTAGGTANNGTTAGGTTNLGAGNPGNSGTEWTTAGLGSGGAGGALTTANATGGDGALYGGAGGGAKASATPLSGAGKQGLIVVTYTAGATVPYGWQRGAESFYKGKQVFLESMPSIALTPDTLPPQVSGMGWFAPPDPKQPRPLERPHPGPAITIEPPELLSKLIGVPWAHAPDDKPKSRPIFDNSTPAFAAIASILQSQLIGVPWAHPPDDKPFSRQIRDNTTPALVLIPSTLPPQIAGMAWFTPLDIYQPRRWYRQEPPATRIAAPPVPISGMAWFEPLDTYQPRRWYVQEPPAVGQVIATTIVPISGMAWFTPPDPRPPRPLERPQLAPAIALTPDTLPPRIAGMGWFTLPQTERILRRWYPNQPPAYGRQILVVNSTRIQIIFIGL